MIVKLILPLLLMGSNIYAQTNKYLILKKRDSKREIVYNEGEIVIVKTFKGEKIKGPMIVLTESLIQVKHKVVPLTNVQCIGKRNPVIGRIASVLVTTGMNFFVYGLSDNLKNGWSEVSENYKASLPMLGLGVPLLTLTHKRKAKKWKFEGQVNSW